MRNAIGIYALVVGFIFMMYAAARGEKKFMWWVWGCILWFIGVLALWPILNEVVK